MKGKSGESPDTVVDVLKRAGEQGAVSLGECYCDMLRRLIQTGKLAEAEGRETKFMERDLPETVILCLLRGNYALSQIDAFVRNYLDIVVDGVLAGYKALYTRPYQVIRCFYRNCGAVSEFGAPWATTEFILSEGFLGRLIEFAKQRSFLDDPQLFLMVFRCVASISYELYKKGLVRPWIDRFHELFKSVAADIDEKTWRSVPEAEMTDLMLFTGQISSWAGQFELLEAMLDLAFTCLKSEYLNKQVMACNVISTASTQRPEETAAWAKQRNLVTFMLEKELHEAVIQGLRRSSAIVRGLRDVTVPQIVSLWQRVLRYHSAQKDEMVRFLSQVLSKAKDDVTKEAFKEILKSSDVSPESLYVLCSLVVSSAPSVCDTVLGFLFDMRKDPKIVAVVDQQLMKLAKNQEIPYVRTQMKDYLISELDGPSISESTAKMLRVLFESGMCIVHDFSQFLANIERHKDVGGIFGLLTAFVKCYGVELDGDQTIRLFEIVVKSPKAWSKLRKLIMKWGRFLGESQNEVFLRRIEQLPIDSDCISEETVKFIGALIPLVGNESGSGVNDQVHIAQLPCCGLEWFVDFFSSLQSGDPRSDAARECLCEIFGYADHCDVADAAKFLIASFEKCDSDNAKLHILDLVWHVIFDVYDADLDTLDFAYTRHRSFSRPTITVNLIWPAFDMGVARVRVSPNATIRTLSHVIASKLLVRKDDVILWSRSNVRLHSHRPLTYYHITSGTSVKVTVDDLTKVGGRSEDLVSYHLNPLAEPLLEIIRAPGQSELQRQAYQVLCALETSEAIMRQYRTNFDELVGTFQQSQDSRFFVEYLLQLFINKKANIQAYANAFIDLLLQKSLSDHCRSDICILLGNCSDLSHRCDELLSLMWQEMANTSNDFVFIACVHVVKVLLQKLSGEQYDAIADELINVFMKTGSSAIRHMNRLFQMIPDKAAALNKLACLMNEVEPGKRQGYWAIMRLLLSPDMDVMPVVEQCIGCLRVEGACDFLRTIVEQHPEVATTHSELLPTLLNFAREAFDAAVLASVFPLCGVLLRANELLLPEFQDTVMGYLQLSLNVWSYLPSEKRDPSLPAGLKNLGTTCYLNSVLQQLFANVDCRRVILNGFGADLEPWKSQFITLFAKMQDSYDMYIDTRPFCETFHFPGNEVMSLRIQQDATELFLSLLDRFPQDVKSLYSGVFVNTILGIDEDFMAAHDEEFCSIGIPVKGVSSFKESMASLLHEEVFTGDNQYLAETLGRKIDVKKFARIKSAGQYLVLQLKRFEYDPRTWVRSKIDDPFEFPDSFNLTPYTVDPEGEPQMYHLIGVIIHNGTLEGGHYASLIKRNDRWYCVSDETSSEISRSEFESKAYGQSGSALSATSAYMLFYSRVDSKACEVVPLKPALAEAIEKENRRSMELYALFSPPFWDLLLEHGDAAVLIQLALEVVIRSGSEYPAQRVLVKIRSQLEDPVSQVKGWATLQEKADTISDILLTCGDDSACLFAIGIVLTAIQVISCDAVGDWVNSILQKVVTANPTQWKSMEYFSQIMLYAAKRDGYAKWRHQWACAAATALERFYSNVNSPATLKVANLSRFFAVIELSEDAQNEIAKLIPYVNSILYDESSFQWFFKTVIRSNSAISAVLDVVHAEAAGVKIHFVMKVVSCWNFVEDRSLDERIGREIRRLGISETDVLYSLKLTYEEDPYILKNVLTHSRLLYMWLILSNNVSSRMSAQALSQAYFSAWASWGKGYKYAEEYVQGCEDLPSFDGEAWLAPATMEDYEREDMAALYRDLVAAVGEAGSVIRACFAESPNSMRYAVLFRILHWSVRCLHQETEEDVKTLFDFVKEVGRMNVRTNFNMMEAVRLLEAIQEPIRSDFINENFSDFCGLFFPFKGASPAFNEVLFCLFIRITVNLRDKTKLKEFVKTSVFLEGFGQVGARGRSSFIQYVIAALVPVAGMEFVHDALCVASDSSNNVALVSSLFDTISGMPRNEAEFEKFNAWLMRHLNDASIGPCVSKFSSLHHPYETSSAVCEHMADILQRVLAGEEDLFGPYIAWFIEKSPDIRNKFIEAVNGLGADTLTACNLHTFWVICSLYFHCLLFIESPTERSEYFWAFFDACVARPTELDRDADNCFRDMTNIIEKFGFEVEEMMWSLAISILLDQPTLSEVPKRRLARQIIKSLEPSAALDQFASLVSDVFGGDLAAASRSEKTHLFVEAHPSLRPELARILQIPDELVDQWMNS